MKLPVGSGPLPGPPVGIVGRDRFQGAAVLLNHKDLLAEVAAKGLSEGDWLKLPTTPTGTGVVGSLVNFVAFRARHNRRESPKGLTPCILTHYPKDLNVLTPMRRPGRCRWG